MKYKTFSNILRIGLARCYNFLVQEDSFIIFYEDFWIQQPQLRLKNNNLIKLIVLEKRNTVITHNQTCKTWLEVIRKEVEWQ